ncbi:lipid A-modifier LpxR family protein [Thioclava sp. GXIMD2076]|uniref:lipid A-modifier LpxR family protein n=1 Tax=Thioclava sp. GXIMD2076 TaxID=3131931 RepID=UPI0030CD6E0B
MCASFRLIAGLLAAYAGLAAPACSENASGFQYLGWSRFQYNDLIGDGHDRWQSGGISVSVLAGREPEATLPAQPFALWEFRLSGAVIAPQSLTRPAAQDRRYVSRSELSARSYFEQGGWQGMVGFGLVGIGPDTLPGKVQKELHDLLDQPDPSAAQDDQLGDEIWPMVAAELRYPVDLGPQTRLVPFVSGKSGDEDLLTAGVDLLINAPQPMLWLRDDTLGRLYMGLGDKYTGGTTFGLGADVTHVGHSNLFPEGGVEAEDTRYRLRAFVSHSWDTMRLSYGATWLSEEYVGQPEGQVVGDLRLDIRF